jgi:hypothetical protein
MIPGTARYLRFLRLVSVVLDREAVYQCVAVVGNEDSVAANSETS